MYNRVGEVDNAAGVYQAVEGFTSEPFLPLRWFGNLAGSY